MALLWVLTLAPPTRTFTLRVFTAQIDQLGLHRSARPNNVCHTADLDIATEMHCMVPSNLIYFPQAKVPGF